MLFGGADSGDRSGELLAHLGITDCDLWNGRADASRERLSRATLLASRLGLERGISACVAACGRLLYTVGETERGVRLLGAGSFHRGDEDEDSPVDVYNIVGEAAVAAEAEAREFLGDERFTALHNEGRAMSLDEALAEVREYLGIPESAEPESKTSEELDE